MVENLFLIDGNELISQTVPITCPTCNFKKDIHVPSNILKKSGLTTISIPKDTICDHHFQIFLDKDFKVRGYQKVDFELMDQIIKVTHFNCQLCNSKIELNINDESSYLKKDPHKKFLGKDLSSYKVAHYYRNELHVNNVLVDDHGDLYDFLNSYIVKLENYGNKQDGTQKFFNYSEQERIAIESHQTFNVFIIFNIFDHWIYELVRTPLLNSIELVNLLFKKIMEANSIYSEIPPYLTISIADKTFHLWVSHSNVICINLKNELNLQWLNPVLEEFIGKALFEGNLISNSPRLLMLNDFFNEDPISKSKIPLITRLISDDLLYSKIQIRFKERIDRIINRLGSEFSIEKSIILSFFYQDNSLIEFLRKIEDYEDLGEFIELIDFVNRRKLLE